MSIWILWIQKKTLSMGNNSYNFLKCAFYTEALIPYISSHTSSLLCSKSTSEFCDAFLSSYAVLLYNESFLRLTSRLDDILQKSFAVLSSYWICLSFLFPFRRIRWYYSLKKLMLANSYYVPVSFIFYRHLQIILTTLLLSWITFTKIWNSLP